jgi:UDP-N-acetylmuramoyl-tripeptide--D-alanyl-D-alanine ligase
MTPGPEGPALRLTARWVAGAIGAALVAGDPSQEFHGVSIDTRTLAAGDLFIAIRGERFDGAEFAEAAIGKGAAGVVVPRRWSATLRQAQGRPEQSRGATASAERGVKASAERVVLEVDDPTLALQALGHAVRRESGTKVVAITGSAGKTTTKEVTAELLAARYRVVRNRGNLNNHIGLPLSLVELRQRPEIAVVELGMNHPGEISTLVRVAEPDVRVWTNVGEAHLGFFASLDAIADAKAEIFEAASPDTVLVANADDDRIVSRLPSFAGRVVSFGIDRHADVRASEIVDRGIDGTSARITTARGSVEMATPLVGRGNLANILAATAVAEEFGIRLETIAELAATLRPAAHRGEIVRLRSGITIIDDSYNANPTATRRAIDVLIRSASGGRRIAVLGEMLELGDRASELHAEVGRAAAAAKVDVLLAVGGAPAAALAGAAIAAGLSKDAVQHFGTSAEAAEAAVATTKAGDLVLVKGSRGVRTDLVVDRLKAERG